MSKCSMLCIGILSACLAPAGPAIAQQATPQQPGQKPQQQAPVPERRQQPAEPEKKPVVQTPAARLASAKTVYIARTRGGDIPYDVIRATVEGWGRLTLVSKPEKADLIMEVASSSGDSDVRVSGGMSPSAQTGQLEQSTKSSKDFSSSEVTLTVLDAQNKRVLWRGTETAKFAVKQKARENNLVEASEKLASKFHDRLEPALAR